MNTTTTTQNAADLLDAAADYLDTHKWTRGTLYNPKTGGCCAVGALRLVGGAQLDDDGHIPPPLRGVRGAYDVARRVADEIALERSALALVGFNDVGTRDKRKIQRLFRAAAKRLRTNAA